MSDGLPPPATFLSGERGDVRRRSRVLRRATDAVLDLTVPAGTLDRLAARVPRRAVVVASIYRPASEQLSRSLDALASERHRVELRLGSIGRPAPALAAHTRAEDMAAGKFENLNALLAGALDADWLLVVDDDVDLPPRFLDRFLGACEHFDFALAQPAQSLASHAAWRHVRRRPLLLARETRFVEIGPVTAFRRDAAARLLPFPPLRYGWGLDVAWAADALAAGWRLGIVDALPVRHERSRVAAGYDSRAAIAEAQRFLAGRPYLSSAAAPAVVASHRRA